MFECAGAGDDQHADRGDQPEGHSRLGSEIRPCAKGDERHDDDGRNEPAGDLVGEPLDRRARSLRFGDHLDDLGEHSVAANLVSAHHEAARYSSAVASAAAEDLATLNSKVVGGVEVYGRGSRQRLMNLDVPEPVITAMEKSKVAPVTVQWTAPRDGTVLERNAIEGMRANPGDVLFRIADTSVVWALVDVAERDLGSVAIGQSVAIRARSFPGRTFSGNVAVIYPTDKSRNADRACPD